jgi:GDPmannose 4,6-dehydratase
MYQNYRVIIFGSNGQDGYYLGKLLKEKNIDFIGISRSNSDINGDIGDYRFVKKQIGHYMPTHIFHFAANSTTKHDAIFENHQSISTGTLNVLESARLICPETKIFITGSAMQFKNNGSPIDEKTSFEPSSAYSVARIQSVFASRYYRNKFGLKIYVGYLFNHDSPLRSDNYINKKIVMAAKRIACGSQERLEIGDLTTRKEYAFAGDIMQAIWTLVNQSTIYEAVIGTGNAYSIKDWIEICFSKLGLHWEDHVVKIDRYKAEYNILISNPTLIKSLGWNTSINIEELADIMIAE